jgi:anti-sigma-K factor RskA
MRRRRQDLNGGEQLAELAALADGSLAPERRAELEAQIAEAPELAELLAEQERAVGFARSAASEVDAPAGLRARVDARRQARRIPGWRRPVLIGAAAAATVVVAVAVGLGVFGSSTSGERFHASLAATGLAPGASGNATLTKTTSGWRIELDATGLPRLDNGRFYEAWLKNPAGVLVPVGTFNEGRKVTLWAGVSPKTFTSLSVTREEADGNQASSGRKVLVAKIPS